MGSHRTRITLVWSGLLLSLSVAGAGCGGSNQGAFDVGSLPARAPRWVSFNAPVTAVTLPSFMVGDEGELSSGCWSPAPMSDVGGAGTLSWSQAQQREFGSNVQATFSKYLVTAGLDASLASALTQHWSIDASGLSFTRVDPASIRPNFANVACTTAALGWFADKRFVVTEAIKAASVKITATSAMSQEQTLKLDAAIAAINAKFHADFHHLATGNDALEIDAANAYIGGVGTTLVSRECSAKKSFDIAPNTPLAVCDGQYTLSVALSSAGDRYTLAVTPSDGSTASFDDKLGDQQVHHLDDLHVVRVMVARNGNKLSVLNMSILLVGASG
jgi:hypothetical protein